jgi:tetratricopeptide (TPR) repeat protein
MGPHYQRAVVLCRQERYAQAERELREQLLETPDDGCTHAFLGRCLALQGRLPDALAAGEEGVRLAPDLAYAHRSLGQTYLACDRLERAEAALREALRLNPHNPDHHEWLSWVQHRQGDTRAALETASWGLEIDPDHLGCLNRRGQYERQLGDRCTSEATLRAALALDPASAFTHANLGWTLWLRAHDEVGDNIFRLARQRQTRAALAQFEESLRLSPNDDWSRKGLIQILQTRCKAVYRSLMVILGGLFCAALFWSWSSATGERGSARPFPLAILEGLLTVVTLITFAGIHGPPYVLMGWSRVGRAVLTPGQQRAARVVAVCLIATAFTAMAALLTRPPVALGILLLVTGVIGPLTVACEAPPGRTRWLMGGYAAVFATLGAASVPFLASGNSDSQGFALVCLLLGMIWGARKSRRIGDGLES